MLGEVLVCDHLSIGELFMRVVQVVRNPEVNIIFHVGDPKLFDTKELMCKALLWVMWVINC